MLPVDEINELVRVREGWSDVALLAELTALEPLPAESVFYTEGVLSRAAWAHASLFIALSDVCAARKLRPAAKLLLDRASEGDPGEMMRGLRHALEAIFAPDWADLARVCIECLRGERAGTRMWAADQLGILREPMGLNPLIAALDDPPPHDCDNLLMAITAVCRAHPRLAPEAIVALRMRASTEQHGALSEQIARSVALLEKVVAAEPCRP